MARRMLGLGVYGNIPFDTLFDFFYDLKDGNSIKILQCKNIPSLGSWAYDSAICLANYLESAHHSNLFPSISGDVLSGKTLLELGAGTGLVGLVAGYYGARAIITDLEPLLPLIQLNISENIHLMKALPSAMPLPWGSREMMDKVLSTIKPQFNDPKEKPSFDIVILANCIYYESSLEVLLETVLSLIGIDSIVLACYEERTSHIKSLTEKWHNMVLKHFTIEDVQLDASDMTEKHFHDYVRVVIMRPTQMAKNINKMS